MHSLVIVTVWDALINDLSYSLYGLDQIADYSICAGMINVCSYLETLCGL